MSEHDDRELARLRRQLGLAPKSDGPKAVAPGKVTSLEAMPNGFVGLAKPGARTQVELSEPHAIEARATEGPEVPLPHLGAIQKAFGRHDVSRVRAHVGDGASEANHQLGAHAFAFGDRVAFANAPDLFTAAHEAAHVVQQRAGVAKQDDAEQEQLADRVAAKVTRGESAERLLDRIVGGSAAAPVLQFKKPGAPTQPAPGGDFDGDYAIESGGNVARIHRRWLRDRPIERWFEILIAMQAAGAVPWAQPQALHRFARLLAQKHPMRDDIVTFRLDAIAIATIGVPQGEAPKVERLGDDLMIVLPGVGSTGNGEVLDLDVDHNMGAVEAICRALERYVGIPIAVKARTLKLGAVGASTTTAVMRLHDRELATIFGEKAWNDWKHKKAEKPSRKRRARSDETGHSPHSPQPMPATEGNDLDADETARVVAWFAKHGAKPRHVDRALLTLVAEIESDPALAAVVRTQMQRASLDRPLDALALRAAIDRARVELERTRLGLGTFKRDSTLEAFMGPLRETDPFDTASVRARLVQHGLLLSGRSAHFDLALDWGAYRGASDDAFANRDWHAVVEWVIERADIQGPARPGGAPLVPPVRFKTEHLGNEIGIDHTFQLGPHETSGIWTVHAFLHTSHFAPKHVTATVEVKTESARMSDLRREAFAGMVPARANTASHRFDIGTGNAALKAIDFRDGGKDGDADGTITRGELPEDFHARSAAERADSREAEIERTEELIDYLSHSGDTSYVEALNAARRRIERLRRADADVKSDEARGWESFELRGTYLSRQPEVPSGALDLYGSVRRERIRTPIADVDRVLVHIRDHSQKLGPELTMYSGTGATFEAALEEAFVTLCKEYPEGKVSVMAQVMDASRANPIATRQAIGFELATTSPWKRIKDKVYNPVVQTVVNVAATALMIFQPELAPFIMPILTVQNTVANVDELVRRYENNTLKAGFVGISLAQIGLEVMPYLRGARILQTESRLVAFEAVNMAGMGVVMALQTRDAIAQIQEGDIAALADQYRELIELQKNSNPSDPELSRRQRAIENGAERIRKRVTEEWSKAIGENGIFIVGSHVLTDTHRRAVGGADAGWAPGHLDAITDQSWYGSQAPSEGAGTRTDHEHASNTKHEASAAETAPPTSGGNSGTSTHESHASAPNPHDSERTTTGDGSPPKPPGHPSGAGNGGSSGPRKPRPSQIGSESAATPQEQAMIDAAVADREATVRSRGDSDPSGKAGQHIADEYRTEQEADHARWQSHGLQDDPRGRALLEDPEFRRWYERWMSLPGNVSVVDGKLHVKLPHGVPDEIAAKLRAVAENGNIGIMARADVTRKQIAEALPGKKLDPTAEDWQTTRAELVKIVGEDAVRKFEIEKTERMGARGSERAAVDEWLRSEVDKLEFGSLRKMYPGTEIYVTGSGAQPQKAEAALREKATTKPGELQDLDLILVVPDETPPNVRAEIEARLSGMHLKRPVDPDQPNVRRPPIPVDGKVMTQSEFAGYSMMETAKGRTPLSNARVDAWSTEAVPGTGATGIDLHNHIMGVPTTDYYVQRIGGGSAIDVLEKAWILVQSHGDEIRPTTKAAIASAIADVRNGEQAGLARPSLEARARRGLDQALAAHPEEMPFDHTYDLRDLLVQHHIDKASPTNPNGRFENFAIDVLTELHDQGISSSEQSVSISKLNKRFDEQTMARAHASAKAKGKDSELNFLAMLPTDKILSAKPGQAELPKAIRDQVEAVLKRTDVKGVDFAGPEAQMFTTPEGMAQFKQVYKLVAEAAKARGEPLVLRPHVGEGYDPHATGEHVKVAQHNLDLLLRTLDDLGYKSGREVIVRFGHATHATEEQLQHMQRLGVIVEANVGSNLATGAIASLDQHPLLRNLYYGVPTVLATDAQGVMSTTLADEYRRAAELIERFRRDEIALKIGSETKRFSDLPRDKQELFSLKTLEGQIASYHKRSEPNAAKETP